MAVSGVRSFFARFFDTALGYAVGGAASAAIEPTVTPLAEAAWEGAVAAGVGRALNPADLAAMAVQGVMAEVDAAGEAAKSGVTPERFHRLFLVNGDPIAPEQALDLWNRGEITEDDVDRALLQSRLKPEWVSTFKLLRRQIVQVSDLAEMVVQGILDQPAATAGAARLGYQADDFARFVRLAGNPPGPEQMLEAWNRNLASEADVDRALVQSRLKPEWVDLFKRLRVRPPSPALAVEATIKQRITPEQGRALAAETGVAAEHFDLMVEAGGRPIATGEALTLYRRGEYTAAQVVEAIARSDVRTQYAPDILKLATVYPSLYQIKQMLQTGAISDELATAVLRKEGYPDDLIAGVLAAGHGVKLAGSKQLAQTAILNAYKTQQLSAADASADLQGLGYTADDVGVLLAYADYERTKQFRDAVIAVVKARYLQQDIDENTATTLLDTAGVPAAERDQYLALWTFDVQANPRLLTLAECNALVKKRVWGAAEYQAYLPRLGYQAPEIALLVELHASG